jgi:hypothetical protein
VLLASFPGNIQGMTKTGYYTMLFFIVKCFAQTISGGDVMVYGYILGRFFHDHVSARKIPGSGGKGMDP